MPLSESVSYRQHYARPNPELTPADCAEWSIDLADILARLSKPLQSLLIRLLRSMTVDEAAHDLGISRSTASRRFAELRVRLHEIDPDRFGNFDATDCD